MQLWRWVTRCEALSEDGIRCDERAGHVPRSPHRAHDDIGLEVSWPCEMRSFAGVEPVTTVGRSDTGGGWQ